MSIGQFKEAEFSQCVWSSFPDIVKDMAVPETNCQAIALFPLYDLFCVDSFRTIAPSVRMLDGSTYVGQVVLFFESQGIRPSPSG